MAEQKESVQTNTIQVRDWSGADDPDNPHNWPLWKRIYNTIPPALFAFTITFASSVYTPGLYQVSSEFHIGSTASLLGLSLFSLGLGFGPVIAAPMSETFGRAIVYIVTPPLFMLFTLGAGFSNNLAALLVCRFLAGLVGGPVLAVGAGTQADLSPPHLRAIFSAFFLMAPFLGSAFGPVIGGFAAQYKGWRWTMWCTLFIAVPVFATTFGISETYKKIILQRRAKRLGLSKSVPAGPQGYAAIKFLLTVTLIRPVHMLFTEPIVGFYSAYTAFNFAVLFAFFAAFPIVFGGVYGFSISQTGLAFLGVGVGVCLAVITGILAQVGLYQKQFRKNNAAGLGLVAPEHRLYPAMMGSFGVSVGLFWFAWTARKDVHWISPVLATIPFAWGNMSVFYSAALYLTDTYGPLNGASAMAANGLARYTAGAALPLVTVQMYNRLGIAWATSLLGFVSLAMLPIPWVLFKWGSRIRAKSAYETIKA